MLLDKVRRTIKDHNLIEFGDKVVCAVSGGADSICLLHALLTLQKEYGIEIFAANVNHLIRGEEAERDSEFVKKICKASGVKLFYREYDIPALAKEMKLGEEECGRVMRYSFFDEICASLGNAKVATAHNLNDNAETVLFHLIRGSAAEGLTGIKYKRGNIIRPLLDVSRNEIERYLVQNSIEWCDDSSNFVPVYARNKLRINVFPRLNEICSNAEEHISIASSYIAEDNLFINEFKEKLIAEAFSEDCIDLDKFFKAHISVKRRFVSDVLSKWGVKEINGEKIDSFISFSNAETGKMFDINGDLFAYKEYGKIVLKSKENSPTIEKTLDFGFPVCLPEYEINVYLSDEFPSMNNNLTAVFDADKLRPPFNVRYKKDGDRIFLKGLCKNKKLSDIFTDEKIGMSERSKTPIVEKNGEIIYVCGLRQSANYCVEENTKKYLVIQYITKG